MAAGSIGAAPLIFLAKDLRKFGKKVTVFLGGKNRLQIVGANFFYSYGCNVKVIVEDDDELPINTGLVTDLLETELGMLDEKVSVVTCGPTPMMKAVARMCEPEQISCQLVLESVFACNMGACKGCVVFMQDKTTRHICKDGPPFWAHELDLDKLGNAHVSVATPKKISQCDLSVTLKGQEGRELYLPYPVMGASGCYSTSSMANKYVDFDLIGAIIAKGLTLYPQKGNPPPRVCETPSGMLNSIGLENVGLENFLKDELPLLKSYGKPIIVNISGKTINEYVKLARRLNNEYVDGIEVNISCPNVEKGNMAFGVDKDMTRKVVSSVRQVYDGFMLVKLTPNVTDHIPIARAAVEAGADAISLTNTLLGMAIDIQSRRPKLKNIIGGLSGPAISPVSLRMVYQLYIANIGIPIIGVGGIYNADTALQFLIGGASAVQIGTAGFSNSQVFTETVDGTEEYMLAKGFADIPELSGSLITD